ncbi:MAG: RAMP superfamily CRISPR-associated protein [Nitratireductor sp.]
MRSIDHVKQDGFATIHAVKLDRFGGGPVHGGLFSTNAAINPHFKVALDVENRAGSLNEAALSLYQELLEDLRLDGIRLGHGSNKGYGWFDVE